MKPNLQFQLKLRLLLFRFQFSEVSHNQINLRSQQLFFGSEINTYEVYIPQYSHVFTYICIYKYRLHLYLRFSIHLNRGFI